MAQLLPFSGLHRFSGELRECLQMTFFNKSIIFACVVTLGLNCNRVKHQESGKRADSLEKDNQNLKNGKRQT